MGDRPLVLVVDDETHMRRYLCALMEGAGYRVLETGSGQEAIGLAAMHRPDVVLLDLGLPDLDGVEVTRRLREWMSAPILIVSARDAEQARVEALDEGADDYLTKPFGAAELLARIRAALRRVDQGARAEPVFEAGWLRIDYAAREVFVDGEAVAMTPTEYRLLIFLAKSAGKVVTHRQILKAVWGPGHAEQAHYVRVYMAHLRRKIERDPARPELLTTEVGVGYRLRAAE